MAPKPKAPAPAAPSSSSEEEEYISESEDNNNISLTQKQLQTPPMQNQAQNPNDEGSEQEETESDEEDSDDSGSKKPEASKPVEKQADLEDEDSESEGSDEDEDSGSDNAKKQETLKQAVSQTLKPPTKQAILQAKQNTKTAQEKTENTKDPETESFDDSEDDDAEKPDSKTSKPVPKQSTHKKEKNKNPAIEKDVKKLETETSDSDVKKPETSKRVTRQSVSETKTPKTGNSAFSRIWKEEDEIKLLEWAMKCQTEEISAASYMEAFHDFMKKSDFVHEKRQVTDKIYKMRKKYLDNAEKWEKEDFDNLCKKKIVELSKQVWGGECEAGTSKSVKKSKRVETSVKSLKRKEVAIVEGLVKTQSVGKRAKNIKRLDLLEENVTVVDQNVGKASVGEFWAKYPRWKNALKVHNSGSLKEEGMSAMLCDVTQVGDARAEDMEKKWKVFQAKEAELKSMELVLLLAQTDMMMDMAQEN